jgi:hypothetical protein
MATKTTKAVLTIWPGRNEHLLEQCRASVAQDLPEGVEHVVVRDGKDWCLTMWEYHNVADLVAWVDYDDIVYPGALRHCFEALEANPTIGLAYTSERRVDLSNGRTISENKGRKSVIDLVSHPRIVHHLAVTRSSCVDRRPLELYKSAGPPCPMDWLIRARAGAQHGMIYVPMIGYEWRTHSDQVSVTPQYINQFQDNLRKIRKTTIPWIAPNAYSIQHTL